MPQELTPELIALRPDMERVEEMIRIFDRPTASHSREMANYIYALEKFIKGLSR
jgi:hypothetical protein